MKRKKIHTIDIKNSLEEFIEFNTSVWNKIYDREAFKNIARFYNEKEYNFFEPFEDVILNLYAVMNVERVCLSNEILYHYMTHGTSTINTKTVKNIDNITTAFVKMKEIAINNKKEQKIEEIVDCIAFLHLGISIMLRVYENEKENFDIIKKKIDKVLNKHFPHWKSSKFLKVRYSIFHKGINLKLTVMRKVYKLNMLKIFLYVYTLIIKKLGIDIKW